MGTHTHNNLIRARAFTLVEVLIGILILGVGLLGLSAVFPAVMSQQRGASDAVEGTAAAESAEAFLKSHIALNTQYIPPLGQQHTNTPGNYMGWESLALDQNWCPAGEWQVVYDDSEAMSLDRATGDLLIPGGTPIVIPVRDRLLPRPTFAGTDNGFGSARFVWDVAARRVIRRQNLAGGARDWRDRLEDQIEVAVFVRRIDQGIRVRDGVQYVPVAEGANGLPTLDGRGTNTGNPNYSPIRMIELMPYVAGVPTVLPDSVDLVAVSEQGRLAGGLNINDIDAAVAQIGQKFVLSNGTVVGVVGTEVVNGVGASNRRAPVMRLDRRIPMREFGVDDVTGIPYGQLDALYTPQVPVGVKVFRVRSGGTL